MIVKQIRVFVKPGRMREFLAAQEIWNHQTAGASGYLGCFCGRSGDEADVITVLLFWESRSDLNRWMKTEHDRIAELAGADRHFDRVEIRILEAQLPPDPPGF